MTGCEFATTNGRPMKTISISFLLALCLTAPIAAAGEFTADKASPLNLAPATRGEGNVVRFTGSVRIAGRFVVAWDGLDRKTRYLRVTFRPGGARAWD